MAFLSKKRREGLEAVYPAPVILVACPRCDAPAGEKCTEQFGGETIWRKTPHRPRIEESKPKLGR